MIPEQKLDALLARHKAIESELATQVTPETYVKLSREFAELGPVVETVRNYRNVVSEIAGLDALIADSSTDAEMRTMAAAEKPQLEQRRAALEQEIKLALLPKDAMDERNVILEIRAGTGGDEASLFAGDLFRMWTDLIKMKASASATNEPKFFAVFSHRSAIRLKRLSLPTACSMRARAL